MLGLIVWCIIIIVIGACILPWWALPTFFLAGVIWCLLDHKKI